MRGDCSNPISGLILSFEGYLSNLPSLPRARYISCAHLSNCDHLFVREFDLIS